MLYGIASEYISIKAMTMHQLQLSNTEEYIYILVIVLCHFCRKCIYNIIKENQEIT